MKPVIQTRCLLFGESSWLSRRIHILVGALLLLPLSFAPALSDDLDLTELSLDELAEIEVTSVSKKGERLWQTAAAAHVTTQDDIRRSGHTSIPEILRTVPGMHVAQIDANSYAVSARGFNGRFATKMLVMIDGLSVYSPFFSGVFWEEMNLPLDSIERIEVIRGPGATVWGANAVNGVVNIITKHAEDSHRARVETGVGNDKIGFGSLGFGSELLDNTYYRIDMNGLLHDSFNSPLEAGYNDEWGFANGSFRLDWTQSASNSIMMTGGFSRSSFHRNLRAVASLTPPYTYAPQFESQGRVGHLLGRWDHISSTTSDFSVNASIRRHETEEVWTKINTTQTDLEFRHRFAGGDRHEIVYGAGARFIDVSAAPSFTFSLDRNDETVETFSAFIQDEIQFHERFGITVGTKLEHNSFTDFEWQPSFRFAWTPTEKQVYWGAVSRAVRTPSRVENSGNMAVGVIPADSFGPGQPTTLYVWEGQESFESEDLLAYELGTRHRLGDWLSLDAAAYYNVYENLGSLEFMEPEVTQAAAETYVRLPLAQVNGNAGTSMGFEIAADAHLHRAWRVRAGYTFTELNLDLEYNDGGGLGNFSGGTPTHTGFIQSMVTLPKQWTADWTLRYVDQLDIRNPDPSKDGVSSYVELNAVVTHRFNSWLSMMIGGNNLLNEHHEEFYPEFFGGPSLTEIGRGGYVGARLTF